MVDLPDRKLVGERLSKGEPTSPTEEFIWYYEPHGETGAKAFRRLLTALVDHEIKEWWADYTPESWRGEQR